jgi:hypothetical protein
MVIESSVFELWEDWHYSGNADRKIFIERGAFSPRLVKGRAIVHRGRSKATDTKKDTWKICAPRPKLRRAFARREEPLRVVSSRGEIFTHRGGGSSRRAALRRHTQAARLCTPRPHPRAARR